MVVVVSSILFVLFLVESSGANAQVTRPAVCGPNHAIILYYYLSALDLTHFRPHMCVCNRMSGGPDIPRWALL